MKIGMITDSLGQLSFDAMLKASAELGLETLEFACGNWSSAPHMKLDRMLESAQARKEFQAKVKDHGLEIAALNCSGNQLAPGAYGKKHDATVRKTFKLAKTDGHSARGHDVGPARRSGRCQSQLDRHRLAAGGDPGAQLAMGQGCDPPIGRSSPGSGKIAASTGSASRSMAASWSITPRPWRSCATRPATMSARITIPAT